MTVSSHPPESLLAGYAGGDLPSAPGLVVAAHLAHCRQCRGLVGEMEAVGGAFLASATPSTMAPAAWTTTLARIGSTPDPRPPSRFQDILPEPIVQAREGFRIRFNNGLWVAQVKARRRHGWRINVIHAPAGAVLPIHDHHDDEYTCVLDGSVVDQGVRYGVGDFMVAGKDTIAHRLEVTPDAPCTSVIATRGRMKCHGALGWISPFLGL